MNKNKQFKGTSKVSDAINDVVSMLWDNPDVGYSVYESNSVVEITYSYTSDEPTPEDDTNEESIEKEQAEDTSEVAEALPETEGAVEEEGSGEDLADIEGQPSDIMETVVESRKDLASNGVEVSIIERSPEIGGRVRKITRVRGEEDYKAFQELLESVTASPQIKIFTSSEVKSVAGVPGNYKVSIDGHQNEILNVGAIIVATGMEEFKPFSLKEFGYGLYPNVFIQSDLVNYLDPEGPTKAKSLLMVSNPKTLSLFSVWALVIHDLMNIVQNYVALPQLKMPSY